MAHNPVEIHEAVLAALASDRSRTWTVQALVDTSDLPVVDIVVALAHLTYRGEIERLEVGQYRSMPTARRKAG